MDVVYICRDGNNEELRYSIRSVVANLPHSKVWVVGGKPDWYIGNHIPIEQCGVKYINARRNLIAIMDSPEISEEFVLMNDDFFIMKPIDKLLNYASGLLYTKMRKYRMNHPSSYYTKLIIQTYDKIRRTGKSVEEVIDYDIHVPIMFEKEKLKSIFNDQIFLWRSVYGNTYFDKYETMDDVKLYPYNVKDGLEKSIRESHTFLSSDDQTAEYIISRHLSKVFPEPSLYEAPLVGIEPTTHRLEV